MAMIGYQILGSSLPEGVPEERPEQRGDSTNGLRIDVDPPAIGTNALTRRLYHQMPALDRCFRARAGLPPPDWMGWSTTPLCPP